MKTGKIMLLLLPAAVVVVIAADSNVGSLPCGAFAS
jgi:hypothetical protein